MQIPLSPELGCGALMLLGPGGRDILTHIFEKLGFHTLTELILCAVRKGMVF